ncbi:MAG: hypothetical protein Q8R45_05995 [Brevundimonas sp.]|uniref:hypothetical protein n=1 Tax=Brevundimonas sp. TaxID=1871086 RepID=UPI002734DBF4|nr:hypothetical protein [Brevundimonas sp.]MDP3656501.1 hypothetical protein [Brevundimonas sp.]MDZ4110816.1 hypothetical protein [Brevundimonas sp.]
MSDFETFTREKIARLRLEADALEKILKEFVGSRARATGASARSGTAATGGFGAVMEALAEAGEAGLSLDQMIAAASERGFGVNRNTLRSQLWSAKNAEKVEQIEPGRYRAVGAEPAPAKADDAAERPPAKAPPPADDDYSSGFSTGGANKPTGPTVSYDLNDDIPL